MDFLQVDRISGPVVVNGRVYYSRNGVSVNGHTVTDAATGRRLSDRPIPHPERGSNMVCRGGQVWINGVRIEPEEG
ncbi:MULTISPECIES: hypothetical protein [Amycolatopsis]|uniref:FHA domain-containing protein n=1 Tax=Amycolatopsis thermalba TaxID=944492 RepID=A0ABY4NR40_9PSEU|nr:MULTISPECIES: hypothetical protein [Amycolatopsis]OXM74551.1 hypothetical protein CF166_04310 [Amycolatopsis sp. KNN50.9b]UQS21766.1 hypothetical protein L1857_02460 [Amycolatopsis thermalba]